MNDSEIYAILSSMKEQSTIHEQVEQDSDIDFLFDSDEDLADTYNSNTTCLSDEEDFDTGNVNYAFGGICPIEESELILSDEEREEELEAEEMYEDHVEIPLHSYDDFNMPQVTYCNDTVPGLKSILKTAGCNYGNTQKKTITFNASVTVCEFQKYFHYKTWHEIEALNERCKDWDNCDSKTGETSDEDWSNVVHIQDGAKILRPNQSKLRQASTQQQEVYFTELTPSVELIA
ncbi:hypothetical protein WICPIJ_006498, partial [Wickerhamomyces pijperi]